MADIKTRKTVKDIKGTDRAGIAGERMKKALIRSRNTASGLMDDGMVSPSEYAQNRTRHAVKEAVNDTREVLRGGTGRVKKGIRTFLARKEKGEGPLQTAPDKTDRSQPVTGNSVRIPAGNTAIKTAEASVKAAEKAAEAAAKTAQKMAEMARQASAAADKAAVAAGRAAVSVGKAVVAALKELFAAIAAGGWVSVVIILVISLAGLIAGSCFGIFFSDEEKNGGARTVRDAVTEINREYLARIDTIKSENPHDEFEMSGSRAVWPEVLSVYAVLTTTDPDSPQEVITLTEQKEQILSDLFWEMNDISFFTVTDTGILESDNGNGTVDEERTEDPKTTLSISVRHKTADQMAEQFFFNEEQKSLLGELLRADPSLWMDVLRGIYGSDDQIVQVALAQVGNTGGEPYWSWYGFDHRVEWCGCFVSWCAEQCGYLENGICPKYAGCVNGVEWFRDRNRWIDGKETPSPGMIIFYDWNEPDGLPDHTGIVENVVNGVIHTVEGNSNDACRQCQYPVGDSQILGYGVLIP